MPVPFSEGPFLPDLLKIPTTYCWSPALVIFFWQGEERRGARLKVFS